MFDDSDFRLPVTPATDTIYTKELADASIRRMRTSGVFGATSGISERWCPAHSARICPLSSGIRSGTMNPSTPLTAARFTVAARPR